jgi:hypothetical protein
MKIKLSKYVSGTFVETYEQSFEVPDDVELDQDAIINYLENEGMLNGDWGDRVDFDENIQNIEYQLE